MVAGGNSKSDNSFARTFATRAFAACFAEICTLLKKGIAEDGMALPIYRGMLGTVGTIAKEEGLAYLWKDIVPGLHRECLYGGLRIGLYEPVSLFYRSHDGWIRFWLRNEGNFKYGWKRDLLNVITKMEVTNTQKVNHTQ